MVMKSLPMKFVDRGRGRPLLLVHGFPLNRSMWRAQIDALSDSFRVIAPDLPGFGETPANGDAMTMRGLSDDLANLLDHLGVDEPVALGGLSMGGYIAWQFWRHWPQRLGALVLCDTRAAADSDDARANRLRMAEHVAEYGTEHIAAAMVPNLVAQATALERPEIVAALRAMIIATSPETIAAAQRAMADRPDALPWLGEIKVPVLAIVGQEDAITPVDEMRQMAAAIPNAKLVVVPRAGHLAPMENAPAVNHAIREFLS